MYIRTIKKLCRYMRTSVVLCTYILIHVYTCIFIYSYKALQIHVYICCVMYIYFNTRIYMHIYIFIQICIDMFIDRKSLRIVRLLFVCKLSIIWECTKWRLSFRFRYVLPSPIKVGRTYLNLKKGLHLVRSQSILNSLYQQ